MASALEAPSFADVLDAKRRLGPHVVRTPLHLHAALAALVGTEVWVKHENHQVTGAFKARGGVNLVSQLGEEDRVRGVIAASTGNHGQSVAYGAEVFGVKATVVVPEGANPVKIRAIQDRGAEVVIFGTDFDEAREHCQQLAEKHGIRYVHSGNEPLLIAGVATAALEILEDRPDVDVIIVPIGGGSGAAGACIVANAVRPAIEVIGVQSEAAPAAYRSWRERSLLEDRMGTAAEGLATRVAFELPQRILWERLDDFVLVSEDEIQRATVSMIETTRNLVEPAGASPLAAAIKLRERLAGRRVALVASGGNMTVDQLRALLAEDEGISVRPLLPGSSAPR
ncbi:MAG: threonine/serine dehydratase [Actinomycetota bacterium]